MVSQQTTISNKLGLHARAAAKLVALAASSPCDVFVQKDDRQVNAKSIMGIMMLAASKGTLITVSAEGEDAELAVKNIIQLIDDKFGEGE